MGCAFCELTAGYVGAAHEDLAALSKAGSNARPHEQVSAYSGCTTLIIDRWHGGHRS